jgi:hypothetical protein
LIEDNQIQIKNDCKNQSDLHSELSHRAIRWISNKATKRGLNTGIEIPIDKGYVVDALAIGDWQLRFDEEHGSNIKRIDDLVFVFESKVSRSDYLKTFTLNGNNHDNRLSLVGSFHWIVAPMGLIQPEEVPVNWGLLEAKDRSLSETKKPPFFIITEHQLYKTAYLLQRYKYKYGYPENLERLGCPECSRETL